MSGWSVIPSIRVSDLDAALDFYVSRLGFAAQGDATHGNVSVVRGDARIMLEAPMGFYSEGYDAAIRSRLGSTSPNALYMEADDLDEFYRLLEDQGAKIVDPLADRPWGQAEFTVEDPAGNWLTFWRKR
jgi:uncharacterized glyoxalase superfamily protein PhnB